MSLSCYSQSPRPILQHPVETWQSNPSIPPPTNSSAPSNPSPTKPLAKKSPSPPMPSAPTQPVPLDHRALCMRKLAAILEHETEDLATLITLEMGKPLEASRLEIRKCADACRYYADNAARILASRIHPHRESLLRPLGPPRHHPRRHALELSLLAGLPLSRARAHGRQRRSAQTRLQRPPVRSRHRVPRPPRRIPSRHSSSRSSSKSIRSNHPRRRAHRRRHRHRQRESPAAPSEPRPDGSSKNPSSN